jgi:anhydro-N-acetylmuramic acid kinase
MKIISLGIMSGTSLDGVDLALCRFEENNGKWNFNILDALTFSYPDEWKTRLQSAHQLGSYDFILLHNEYGRFTGELVNRFLKGQPTPDLIASHGHTIFHQPEKRLTFQLGNGATIAAETGITTMCDFRNLDVALGGQGAPLVPIGDRLLFPEYEYCLNIGGFANISFESGTERLAYDICPVNIILNELASEKGLTFDKDGILGKSGKIDQNLLDKLNSLDYYQRSWPKSLGREWCEEKIIPILNNSSLCIEDRAATYYEHVAIQMGKTALNGGKILTTGGGAKNKYLIERIRHYSKCQIVIPEVKIVDFKEALIFAFLGVLSYFKQPNCLSSVKGAKFDNIGGIAFCVNPDKTH